MAGGAKRTCSGRPNPTFQPLDGEPFEIFERNLLDRGVVVELQSVSVPAGASAAVRRVCLKALLAAAGSLARIGAGVALG